MKIICFMDCMDSGGAQRQVIGLARMLKERGHEVEIVDYFNIPFWDKELDNLKISYKHLNANPTSSLSKMLVSWKYFFTSSPDAVIAYLDSPTIIAGAYKMLLPKSFRLLSSDRNTNFEINRFAKLKFFMYRFADFVIPNSYTQANVITTNCPNLKGKVITITNFVDTDRFKQAAADSLSKNRRNLIGVGRVAPQKDLISLLEALNMLSSEGIDLHIDWYGRPNPQSYYDRCMEYLNAHQDLNRYIEFHNHIDNIEDKYAQYGALILPSLYEGFPNVVCEAMSVGLPVLCSDVCDNPYIIKEDVNGFLFKSSSPLSIVETIKKYLDADQDRIDRMRQNNIEYAKSELSESVFIKKYLDLLS